MQYILLIYNDEKTQTDMNEAEQQTYMNDYYTYTAALRDSGAFAGGEALHPVSTATTVRVRDGKTITTDGPFAETKEQLGGYYVVNCDNLDEAIEWAAKIPGARHGSIEVRPIAVFE